MAANVPYEHHPKSNLHKHNGTDIGGVFESIDFDTDYSPEDHLEGRLYYDDQAGTIAIQTKYGDSVTQIGQETVVPATNKTGVDITNGQVVYINGAQGSRPTITLGDASDVATSRTTIGFATVDIANNATGLVAAFGLVRDTDTSAYPEGTLLYLSTTAGEYTDVRPSLPDVAIPVGVVVYQHANQGIILCDVKHCNCFPTIGIGDIDAGDYTEFESDGTMVAKGAAIVWDDLRFPSSRIRQGATQKPDFDTTDLGLLFPQNDASEVAYVIAQMPHEWDLESTISPHIHYIQTGATEPTFKMEYRVTGNGEAPGSFTTLTDTGGIITYPGTGDMLQIMEFPEIDMTGVDGVSAIIDIKLYRDDNDVAGDVLMKEFDIHYQINTMGSRTEYTK